jgi:TatD DNase family protein
MTDEVDPTNELEWFDNHCHLGDERIPGGTEAAIARARAAGVSRMIVVGTDRAHSEAQIEIAGLHDGIWATVGLHPHDAVNGVDTIVDLLDHHKVVAVGECGLDHYYDHSPRNVQQHAFRQQIALANERDLPLVIHTRDAWDDTFAALAAEGVPRSTIFHCFSGGPAEARRCLALGAYLSFSGIVTFKTAADLRSAAALAPLDRVLIETDAPYLTPVPHRGKPNEPAFVPLVGHCLADVRDTTVAAIAQATTRNAMVAFRLPPT